jgi:hypothetical protein
METQQKEKIDTEEQKESLESFVDKSIMVINDLIQIEESRNTIIDYLNKKSSSGKTAVHILAAQGKTEILKLPSKYLSVRDNKGNTAYHLLAYATGKCFTFPEEVKRIKNFNKQSVLDYAMFGRQNNKQ